MCGANANEAATRCAGARTETSQIAREFWELNSGATDR
jgi:hypothetical protein